MRRAAALLVVLALAACGPRGVNPARGGKPPGGVKMSYLAPIPEHTPPTLRGKVRNDTGRVIRLVEYDLFYGVGRESEMDSLVIRDVPARGFREFDFPLPKLRDRPTTWRARFVRVEWAGSAPASPQP